MPRQVALEESGSIKKQLMLAIVIIGRISGVVFGMVFPNPGCNSNVF